LVVTVPDAHHAGSTNAQLVIKSKYVAPGFNDDRDHVLVCERRLLLLIGARGKREAEDSHRGRERSYMHAVTR